MLFGPPFAARDPLVKATATLGLLLILLGVMQWVWGRDAHALHPADDAVELPGRRRAGQLDADHRRGLPDRRHRRDRRCSCGSTKVGTAMRALANDREITAMLGVPVRRVEAVAWFGSGLLCGTAGLLLANLVGLDIVGLTFLVIPALAAALIGQLRSLWVTLAAGFVIGIVQSCLTAFSDPEPRRLPLADAVRPGHHRPLWFARRRQVAGADVVATDDRERSSRHRRRPQPVLRRRQRPDDARPTRCGWPSSPALLVFVMFGLPALLDSYWLQVVTRRRHLQHRDARARPPDRPGRAGLAVPVRPRWPSARGWRCGSSYATDLPFPVLILIAGVITGVIGTLIGLPALRLAGLYLALITLMAAGAITVVLRTAQFPNGGSGFFGNSAVRRRLVTPAPAVDRHRRHRLLPLLRRRRRR